MIEKSQENKMILKGKKDKKEQEKIENEVYKKLLLDENCLFNNEINIDILDNSDNDNFFCKLNLNKKNKEQNINKPNEILKGPINNIIDSNNLINSSNNCTDLIVLSKENNIKKKIFKENIPNEFVIEVNNLINFYKNKKEIEKNNSKIQKYKNINNEKENIEDIYSIKNNSISRNNSKKSIRNRYKQKTMLNLEKKNIVKKNNDIDFLNFNSLLLNNKPNTHIVEGNIYNYKENKKLFFSENNWNINQLGQINIYEEIINIELD